jgi:hypothetical protein
MEMAPIGAISMSAPQPCRWPGFTPPHWPAFAPPLTSAITGRARPSALWQVASQVPLATPMSVAGIVSTGIDMVASSRLAAGNCSPTFRSGSSRFAPSDLRRRRERPRPRRAVTRSPTKFSIKECSQGPCKCGAFAILGFSENPSPMRSLQPLSVAELATLPSPNLELGSCGGLN